MDTEEIRRWAVERVLDNARAAGVAYSASSIVNEAKLLEKYVTSGQ